MDALKEINKEDTSFIIIDDKENG